MVTAVKTKAVKVNMVKMLRMVRMVKVGKVGKDRAEENAVSTRTAHSAFEIP